LLAVIAARAYLYAIKPLASFTKLSPSSMVINLGCKPNPFVSEVAATASGGETIAPMRKANGQLILGINKCTASATSAVVNKTSPTAAILIGLKEALKWCQFVFQAAAYKSGGRKIINTIAGSSAITGNPGIRLITMPDKTNTIGKGNLYLLLSMPRKVIPNNNSRITLTFSIR
jgi:hypothetical protein